MEKQAELRNQKITTNSSQITKQKSVIEEPITPIKLVFEPT